MTPELLQLPWEQLSIVAALAILVYLFIAGHVVPGYVLRNEQSRTRAYEQRVAEALTALKTIGGYFKTGVTIDQRGAGRERRR